MHMYVFIYMYVCAWMCIWTCTCEIWKHIGQPKYKQKLRQLYTEFSQPLKRGFERQRRSKPNTIRTTSFRSRARGQPLPITYYEAASCPSTFFFWQWERWPGMAHSVQGAIPNDKTTIQQPSSGGTCVVSSVRLPGIESSERSC